MALSFCVLMLIMLIITLIIRSFVCSQRVLVGQWPGCLSSAVVLAAVSGRSAAVPPGPRVSQMFPPPRKSSPLMKFMLAARAHSWHHKRPTLVL